MEKISNLNPEAGKRRLEAKKIWGERKENISKNRVIELLDREKAEELGSDFMFYPAVIEEFLVNLKMKPADKFSADSGIHWSHLDYSEKVRLLLASTTQSWIREPGLYLSLARELQTEMARTALKKKLP